MTIEQRVRVSRVLWLSVVFSIPLSLQAGAAKAQGHLDASFGRHGMVDLDAESDPSSGPEEVAVGPHGEIYVIEEGECFSGGSCPVRVYLKRYQADGGLDRSFGGGRILASTADRYAALAIDSAGRPLSRRRDIGWEEMALVQRADGRVELFGGEEEGAHLAVGLRVDGSRDPLFGKEGVKRLGFEVTDATPDGFGGTFLAGYLQLSKEQTGEAMMRMRPDGRIDPSLGRVALPRASNQEGVEILSQGRGRAVVFEPGIPRCRQSCEDEPYMYRVVDSRHFQEPMPRG